MIKVTVKEAAKANGVKNYYQLGLKLSESGTREVKAVMMARRLWEGKHIPTLPTLDLVCEALGCDLKDVVVRVRSNGAAKPKPRLKRR